jgi:hypothetical protein
MSRWRGARLRPNRGGDASVSNASVSVWSEDFHRAGEDADMKGSHIREIGGAVGIVVNFGVGILVPCFIQSLKMETLEKQYELIVHLSYLCVYFSRANCFIHNEALGYDQAEEAHAFVFALDFKDDEIIEEDVHMITDTMMAISELIYSGLGFPERVYSRWLGRSIYFEGTRGCSFRGR